MILIILGGLFGGIGIAMFCMCIAAGQADKKINEKFKNQFKKERD